MGRTTNLKVFSKFYDLAKWTGVVDKKIGKTDRGLVKHSLFLSFKDVKKNIPLSIGSKL